MLIVNIFILALFLLLGILFASGKGAGLIAGYNTLPAGERAKYDEKKLCKTMAKLMFLLAACWVVAAAGMVFQIKALLWIGMALFFAAAVGGAVYVNVSDRRHKKYRK